MIIKKRNDINAIFIIIDSINISRIDKRRAAAAVRVIIIIILLEGILHLELIIRHNCLFFKKTDRFFIISVYCYYAFC